MYKYKSEHLNLSVRILRYNANTSYIYRSNDFMDNEKNLNINEEEKNKEDIDVEAKKTSKSISNIK